MPDVVELVLRGGAATTFLLLSVILLRDGRNRTVARLGALFALSTAWWAMNTQPFAGWSYRWLFPLWVIAYGKAAAFWLFTFRLGDARAVARLQVQNVTDNRDYDVGSNGAFTITSPRRVALTVTADF